MGNIAKGKVAEIEYTLRLGDGTVFDSTEGEPMPYLHGAGEVISGLESALEGRGVGNELSLEIAPADAFGERDEDLVETIDKDAIPTDSPLEEDDQICLVNDDGENVEGVVVGISDTSVTVDFNHPLAGETINVTAKVISIRDATAEELAHGHAHDAYEDEAASQKGLVH